METNLTVLINLLKYEKAFQNDWLQSVITVVSEHFNFKTISS